MEKLIDAYCLLNWMEYRNGKTVDLNSMQGKEARELQPMSGLRTLRSKSVSARAAGWLSAGLAKNQRD
jgi:hypothetical protein